MSGGHDVARLLAYEELRQLVARYAVATDARDLDTLVSLFVDDVRVGRDRRGRDALKEFFTESLRGVGVTIKRCSVPCLRSSKTLRTSSI